MKTVIFIFSLLASVGCQTIYFERGSTEQIETEQNHWHHGGGIFGLVEFTDPFDPKLACMRRDWRAIKNDHSFLTAFVSGVVPYGIYTPWEVSVRCEESPSR